jgi:integrase
VDAGLIRLCWSDHSGRNREGRTIRPALRAGALSLAILHGIRHSYATAALAAGEPLKVVAERLGHASTSISV